MKAILVWLLSAVVCSAQNFAVLTHQAANSEAFRNGFPGQWPYSYVDIGSETNLPPRFKPPWVFATREQLVKWMSDHSAESKAYYAAQESAATQPKRDREAVIRQAVDDLKTIRDSNGTLTALQLSNAVRAIAKALVAVIEEIRP